MVRGQPPDMAFVRLSGPAPPPITQENLHDYHQPRLPQTIATLVDNVYDGLLSGQEMITRRTVGAEQHGLLGHLTPLRDLDDGASTTSRTAMRPTSSR